MPGKITESSLPTRSAVNHRDGAPWAARTPDAKDARPDDPLPD
jgi:hypothetical protein